jgi:predicted DNA-binding protein
MKKKVTIELPPALHQHLEVFAAQNDLSVARTIRHAIRAHINYVEPAPNIVSQTTERPRELSPRKPMTEEQKRQFEEDWNY